MGEIPWETILRDRGTDQSWKLFKASFLSVQEFSVLTCWKSSEAGWKPAWLSKDLFLKLRSKQKMHSQWKQQHLAGTGLFFP